MKIDRRGFFLRLAAFFLGSLPFLRFLPFEKLDRWETVTVVTVDSDKLFSEEAISRAAKELADDIDRSVVEEITWRWTDSSKSEIEYGWERGTNRHLGIDE